MKHKSRLCANEGMQQWGVNYWETYNIVVNWISVRSRLAIESIHEFPIISIDFLPAFSQSELDVDVFMDITLGMGVDVNRVEWFLKLNKSLYVPKQASTNYFYPLKYGL